MFRMSPFIILLAVSYGYAGPGKNDIAISEPGRYGDRHHCLLAIKCEWYKSRTPAKKRDAVSLGRNCPDERVAAYFGANRGGSDGFYRVDSNEGYFFRFRDLKKTPPGVWETDDFGRSVPVYYVRADIVTPSTTRSTYVRLKYFDCKGPDRPSQCTPGYTFLSQAGLKLPDGIKESDVPNIVGSEASDIKETPWQLLSESTSYLEDFASQWSKATLSKDWDEASRKKLCKEIQDTFNYCDQRVPEIRTEVEKQRLRLSGNTVSCQQIGPIVPVLNMPSSSISAIE
jgi:hypothetical protein